MKAVYLDVPFLWDGENFPDPVNVLTAETIGYSPEMPDREIYDGVELRIDHVTSAGGAGCYGYLEVPDPYNATAKTRIYGFYEWASGMPYVTRPGHSQTATFHIDPFASTQYDKSFFSWNMSSSFVLNRTTLKDNSGTARGGNALSLPALKQFAPPSKNMLIPSQLRLYLWVNYDPKDGSGKTVNMWIRSTPFPINDFNVAVNEVAKAAGTGVFGTGDQKLERFSVISAYAIPVIVETDTSIALGGATYYLTDDFRFSQLFYAIPKDLSVMPQNLQISTGGRVTVGNTVRNMSFEMLPGLLHYGLFVSVCTASPDIAVFFVADEAPGQILEFADTLKFGLDYTESTETVKLQRIADAIQIASGATAGVAGLAGSIATGNIAGGIGSVTSIAGTGLQAYQAANRSFPVKSVPGNFLSAYYGPFLQRTGGFFIQVEGYSHAALLDFYMYGGDAQIALPDGFRLNGNYPTDSEPVIYMRGDYQAMTHGKAPNGIAQWKDPFLMWCQGRIRDIISAGVRFHESW